MVFKWIRFITLFLLCATVYYVGEFGVPFLKEQTIPPFGKLLNPYTGFWYNGLHCDDLLESDELPNLNDEVSVYYDDRMVPHIFASNDQDLYFTYGYVTAQNRFWQMDFLSRMAGGNLSSAVGVKALEFDRFHRRIGLLEAAEQTVEELKKQPKAYEMVQAYVAGVNEYVHNLDPKDYPVEFKMMDYEPEEWTAVKSALILKYLAWDLDGGNDERFLSMSEKVYREEFFNTFFPLENPFYKPIIPTQPKRASRKSQRWGAPTQSSFQTQFQSNTQFQKQTQGLRYFVAPEENTNIQQFDDDLSYRKGSNNWAVRGSKTKTGNPILANDPHLSLTMPALWYEAQLNNGSDLNSYGVSVPGLPFIVIGFNEQSAIGFTYTVSDVIDFAKVQLNKDQSQYLFDDRWVNPRIRMDTIEIKNDQPFIQRTIITKVGPIIYTDSLKRTSFNQRIPDKNVAMNWVGTQVGKEFLAGYLINRATNIPEYKEAIKHFNSPGQNMLFATKENDIAITHNGKFPIRSAKQGRFIADKVSSDLVWDSYIPRNQLPYSKNPKTGILFSANQQPIKGYYKYYLGANDFATYERSNRIEEVLSASNELTVQDFKQLQLDNYSLLARDLLPILIENVNRSKLNLSETDAFNEIKQWNYRYSAESKSPIIFDTWLNHLQRSVFLDEASYREGDRFQLPRQDVLADLILKDSVNKVYDNVRTPKVESRSDVIHQSFINTLDELSKEYGSYNDSWKWSSVHPTKLKSLGQIPGFGVNGLYTNGAKRTVNAISGSNGPSWRMIVELGKDRPIGYGIYPGGQNGNVCSKHYNSSVDDWAKGKYYKLNFMMSETEQDAISFITKFSAK